MGEDRNARLLFLAIVSRHLDHLVSVVVKGPSSAGKSFLTERVLSFFPPSAYYALTAMSERALAYGEESIEHRFLVFYEAAGMAGETQTYMVRSLLSEGRICYDTVEKTAEGLRVRRIDRSGPTGAIITTTAVNIDRELETRLLSIAVTDSPERTRSVLMALAEEDSTPVNLERWRALDSWLESGPHEVSVPFGKALAGLIPPASVRLRRDFGALLSLIRAHALLHRSTREVDNKGRIVAALKDYLAVRYLVADLLSEGIQRSISKAVRETVDSVTAVNSDGVTEVSVRKVAERLGIDESSAFRRVKKAIALGYLNNGEERRGRPYRLELGDPIPDDLELLPSPEQLANACTLAKENAGLTPPSGLTWNHSLR